VDVTRFIYSSFRRKNRQIYSKDKNSFSLTLNNYKQSIKSQYLFYFLSTFQVVILQFYICLAVLYKIICLQFFLMCILLSILLFYVFVILPQSVLHDVLLLKTLRVHAPETPSAYSLHQR